MSLKGSNVVERRAVREAVAGLRHHSNKTLSPNFRLKLSYARLKRLKRNRSKQGKLRWRVKILQQLRMLCAHSIVNLVNPRSS